MLGLPQLQCEDMNVMDGALDELLRKTDATAALIIDRGGPLVTERGQTKDFDTTTMAALAAGSFSATQAIAERVGESDFSSVYQQGTHHSILVSMIDESLLLILVFRADLGVGIMKYHSKSATEKIAIQLTVARLRAPDSTVDLVSMNALDAADIFRKMGVS
jgi:predicted regulator of Ras-like GTPase activity (Roadblock/LC7/MglB family)